MSILILIFVIIIYYYLKRKYTNKTNDEHYWNINDLEYPIKDDPFYKDGHD